MTKYFNTAGPIRPDDHYCLSPISRINLTDILSLIEQKKYFVLHAPRQTGKTTCLLGLSDYINQHENYYCLYINVENGQAARNNIKDGLEAILDCMIQWIKFTDVFQMILPNPTSLLPDTITLSSLQDMISNICMVLDKPLVLLVDEIDALVGDTLISVLRQFRSGYPMRPKAFPLSVVLCGLRDVRDYRIHSDIEKTIITGGSAFNIKAESLRLGNFFQDEIRELYLQHTKATGQIFDPDIFPYIWDLTEGQPWLVNALAYEACWKIEKDRAHPITKAIIETAKENLIMRRETHLDVLSDKLREERVRKVIGPILYSDEDTVEFEPDDVEYVIDMGIIKKKDGKFDIANAIYREIIPRDLTWTSQGTMDENVLWYIENGRLNMVKLLEKFQQFFRNNSEVWLERFAYKEAGPHLLLMAFLQRIVNGGGRILREYGVGMKRMDLFLEYQGSSYALELKIDKGSKSKTDGLVQLRTYVDIQGADEGHLILFNRDPTVSWEEKIYHEIVSNKIYIWGM